MKKRRLISIAVLLCLVLALVMPGAIIAAGGGKQSAPDATDIEIVKKVGAKGVPLMGPPSSGPKPHAAKGILGEEVTGNRYAIIIGISDYPGPYHVLEGGYDLSYANNDARTMAKTLKDCYGFSKKNIHLFVDGRATRDAILNKIAVLEGKVSEDDEVVFFFSGHSVKCTPKPTPAQGGGQVGILTWGDGPGGFGYIWDKELKEAFEGFDTDRIVFIFDCCLAGGMIDLGDKGRVVCMATTQTGVAVEYGEDYAEYYGEGMPFFNHGLFTYFLADLGMMYGLADFYPDDGSVTVEEAFDFARLNLEGMSLATPEFWQIPTIGDHFPGDLLL